MFDGAPSAVVHKQSESELKEHAAPAITCPTDYYSVDENKRFPLTVTSLWWWPSGRACEQCHHCLAPCLRDRHLSLPGTAVPGTLDAWPTGTETTRWCWTSATETSVISCHALSPCSLDVLVRTGINFRFNKTAASSFQPLYIVLTVSLQHCLYSLCPPLPAVAQWCCPGSLWPSSGHWAAGVWGTLPPRSVPAAPSPRGPPSSSAPTLQLWNTREYSPV